MKKFLKSRMGDDPFDSPSMESPESSPYQDEIQPPLPLEPPPRDEPPRAPLFPSPMTELKDEKIFLTVPKQECASPEPEIKIEEQVPIVEEVKVPKPICKDFIRGSCSRVGCRYRHEIDLTQLRGIFIFCHNFQNSVCDRPNCRFVHATIFDEQKFYRTGELPKGLMKKPEAQVAPPPPPPPPATESETCKDAPMNLPFMPDVSKPPRRISAQPEELLLNGSPLKRGWLENDEGRTEVMNSTTPQDDEPRAKRTSEPRTCSSYKIMEHRWKFAVKKLDEIEKAAQESALKMSILQKKHQFLIQITWALSLASKKWDHVNATQHMPSNVEQILQQMATMSDCLVPNKDERRSQQMPSNVDQVMEQMAALAERVGQMKDDDRRNQQQMPTNVDQILQKVGSLTDCLAQIKNDERRSQQQMPSNVDQILQQISTLSDCLAQIKNDERRNSSTAMFSSQSKQLLQGQANINKINNNDDNGTKAYQLSAHQLVQQLEAPSSSNSPYQLPISAVNTAPNDQSPVRLANVSSSRQLSNLLNGW